MKLTKDNLTNHWWYRLLKVVYILVVFLAFAGVIAGAVSAIPTLSEYSSTYQIKCDIDGLFRGDIKGSDVDYYSDELTFDSDRTAEITRFVCSDPTVVSGTEDFFVLFEQAQNAGTIPKEKNYEIVIKEPYYYGSWESVAMILGIGIVSIVFFAWLVRFIFL